MTSMLFLALIIVLVSGLIAYIGDLVGRKMGRKRLSLLGLRPRYTAIIISVGVGMLIAAITLAATMAVSAGVRRAFFTPISKLQADLTNAQHAVERTEHELAQSRDKFQDISRQLDRKTADLTDATERFTKSQNLLRRKQQQLRRVQQQLTKNRQQLKDTARKLKDAVNNYTRVHRDLSASRKQLDETELKLTEAVDKLVQMTQTLERERSQLATKRDQLAAEVGQLTEQVQVLRQFAIGAFSPLTFASGQEIISGVVATTGSEESRKAWLTRFIKTAEEVIHQRNTELPDSANALIFLGGEEPPARITTEEAIDTLARSIASLSSLDSEAVVRLAPANNVTVNGQALIFVKAVEVTPNYQIYRVGSEVARLEFTATDRTTTAEVMGRLVDELLMTRMPAALREQKMLMIARRFDPAHPTATWGSPMPVVPWVDLLATAEKVRANPGAVSVVARTRTPARRAGPLDFTLEVIPAQGQQ